MIERLTQENYFIGVPVIVEGDYLEKVQELASKYEKITIEVIGQPGSKILYLGNVYSSEENQFLIRFKGNPKDLQQFWREYKANNTKKNSD